MPKPIEYYKSKILALRNAMTDLLQEMEAENPSSLRKRQNKREARILNFDAMYNKPKKAK